MLPTIGWVSTYEGLPHVTTKAFTISFKKLEAGRSALAIQ